MSKSTFFHLPRLRVRLFASIFYKRYFASSLADATIAVSGPRSSPIRAVPRRPAGVFLRLLTFDRGAAGLGRSACYSATNVERNLPRIARTDFRPTSANHIPRRSGTLYRVYGYLFFQGTSSSSNNSTSLSRLTFRLDVVA